MRRPFHGSAGRAQQRGRPRWMRVWRLRSHLSALLIVTTLLTFALVAGAMMAYRVPQIERRDQQALQERVRATSERMELVIGSRQSRLLLLSWLLDGVPARLHDDILDNGVHDNVLPFDSVYRVSPQGRVQAVGLAPELRRHRLDMLGRDVSASRLFQDALHGAEAASDGAYTSLLTGARSLGLAIRDAQGYVLIAEVPFDAVLAIAAIAAGPDASSIWLVERSGALIAGSAAGPRLGAGGAAAIVQSHGERDYTAGAPVPGLDWYFVARTGRGLANARVRDEVLHQAMALIGCLLAGLLTAPFGASRLARPLQHIVTRAAQTTAGHGDSLPWPRGPVLEFNRLAADLQTMEGALRGRQDRSQAIFHAAPVPMVVVDATNDGRFLDVNEAWALEYRHPRETTIGRTAAEIGLFPSPGDEAQLRAQMSDGRSFSETRLLRGDGADMWVHVFAGQYFKLKDVQLRIWATVDIGPVRRIEQQLRELNQDLEFRVAQRTHAMAASHDALIQTVEQLRAAQDDLVLKEKLAALGSLVAGVAHELNTPLGNGVMTVSALGDATRRFKASMQGGLRRADLQQFVDDLAQGADIASRNLRRAADLVQSFKQVAVDQSSDQRRSFEVSEVVHEIVVSLRPSFVRRPYTIEVEVPATGLRLDSYPGALGQAIANLIQNAVVHAFGERDHGVVRITAWRDPADGTIALRVADDGLGIPADILPRVFEPFVTTRRDSGGTGLGLHISYNAIVNLMGGTLSASSVQGQGAVFDIRLPPQAPGS